MMATQVYAWSEVDKHLTGIHHQFTPSLARILFEHALGLPDGAAILEIGPYHGYTTCALAYGCVGTRKHIWTIDTFHGNPSDTDKQDGESYLGEFLRNIVTRGLEDTITPLVGWSEEFYLRWSRPLDLLFIDGNHANEVVQGDLDAFFPHLRADGWLFMHDVYPEPVKSITVNPTWLGVQLSLTDCRHNLNLAWGRKP